MNHTVADSGSHHPHQNGGFSQNAEPGPSTLPRDSHRLSPHDDHASYDVKPPKQRDPPKKKKATRACFHCQKAHLTCDDTRPCQRCIKRGCADTCVEGHRKKAKYLLEENELESLKSSKNRKLADPPVTTPNKTDPYSPGLLTPTDGVFSTSIDPTYAFGSEGANLEYSMISQLLNTAQVPTPLVRPDFASRDSYWNNTGPSNQNGVAQQEVSTFPAPDPSTSPEQFRYPVQSTSTQYPLPSPHNTTSQSSMPQYLRTQSSGSQTYSGSPIQLDQSPQTPVDTASFHSPASQALPTQGHIASRYGRPPFATSEPHADNMDLDHSNDVYTRVTAPYDYTAGYHYLMRHLQNGTFDNNDILRVVRALAIFRPSLIALQVPLSAEDETFVEKCFQRSLLELDKLISMSGTPTVVWRRTGEICLVGHEFSLLTEWPRQELLVGKRFIYELFESQSTVEYWENFANHAFENTTQSVHSHCVLVKPTGQHIPCTFCFSIRRDLFDLPYVVIGQWLPML